MNTRSAIVVVLAPLMFLSAREAQAEVRFEPPVPVGGRPFNIVYDGVWRDSCVPTTPRLEVFDRTIIVTFKLPVGDGCATVLSPWTATIEVAKLDGSEYGLLTRVEDETLTPLFEDRVFTVAGQASRIDISGSSDATAGNRVVYLGGPFSCTESPCPLPEVWFGSNRSPAVQRDTQSNLLSAVVPPGSGLVDVSVVARETYRKLSGFQYLARDDWEALLVPVYTPFPIDGALGSRWTSDFTLLNQNRAPLEVGYDVRNVGRACVTLCSTEMPFWPGVADSYFSIYGTRNEGSPAIALIHVRKEAVDNLAATLRTRDLSRQEENWGCEIPVVRESGLRKVVTLVDVPREDRFRQRLRIYDPVYPAQPVTAEFHGEDGALLATKEVELVWPEGSTGGLSPSGNVPDGSIGFPAQPAFAEIDLASLPELEGHRRIWIRVTARGGEKIWAFVSITNNATQHVSTVTPQ